MSSVERVGRRAAGLGKWNEISAFGTGGGGGQARRDGERAKEEKKRDEVREREW